MLGALKTPLMIFALVVAAIALAAALFSRCSSSYYETEAANIAGVAVAGRLKKAVSLAQKTGRPVSSCRDHECEKVFPGFRLPRGVAAHVDVQPDGVTISARQETATTEAVWDSRNPEGIMEVEIP